MLHGEWWWIVGLLCILGPLLAVLLFPLFARRLQQSDAFLKFAKSLPSDATKQVSLGYGTLIPIAAFVLVGSWAVVSDLESKVSRLGTAVEDLKKSVDSQTGVIRELQAEMKKPQQPAEAQATKQE